MPNFYFGSEKKHKKLVIQIYVSGSNNQNEYDLVDSWASDVTGSLACLAFGPPLYSPASFQHCYCMWTGSKKKSTEGLYCI